MSIQTITFTLNAILMIAMPVGLAVFLTRRWKTAWRIWWIGAATFILSQVGHIPFNWGMEQILNRTGIVYWSLTAQQLFNATFLGLSAGVFEEGARYLVLRFWAKDARSWRKGVLLGAGHGGSEAILFGCLALVTFFNMLAVRNMDLAGLVPVGQIDLARQQISAYWNTSWPLTLFGALERFLTLPIQIFLSVLVLQTFIRKQWFWLWLAILIHALVDGVSLISMTAIGVYWTEGVVAVFSILSVLGTWRFWKQEAQENEPSPPEGFKPPSIRPIEETRENLANTQYHDQV